MSALPPQNTTSPSAKLKKWAYTALAIGVCIYIVLLLVLKLSESRLLYWNSSSLSKEVDTQVPTRMGIDVDELSIKTADGETLYGWVTYPDPDAANGRWVLFFHGNEGNVSSNLNPDRFRALSHLGLGVVCFDYRGYGKSTGKPTEEGLYLDAKAAYEYLRYTRKVPSDSILIMGFSLGTGVAVNLASSGQPAAGLILEAPYTSIPDVAATHFGWAPVSLLMSNRYESASKIGQVPYPLLILHSSEDEAIPYAQGEALLQQAKARKTLVPLKYKHMEAPKLDSANYYGSVQAFVASIR